MRGTRSTSVDVAPLWLSRRRRSAPVIAAILSVFLSAGSQTPQTPTFRGSVHSVVVDFTAVSADGTPVSDLRREDLTLKVDGKVRTIETLEFLRLAPVESHAESGAPVSRHVAPASVSNAEAEAGRVIILVVNHESLQQGDDRQVLDAAGRFLDSLTPRDRVGLATLPLGRVEVDLTRFHHRIRRALPFITGHAPRPTSIPIAPNMGQCAVHRSLYDFLDGLRGTPDPKWIVFVGGTVADTPLCHADFEDTARMASQVRATFFLIQPLRFGESGYSRPDSGMDALAGMSGGESIALGGGRGDAVFRRIGRMSSAYYLLSFAAQPSERTGKFFDISLTTARNSVTIRARREFRIAPAAKPAVAVTTASQRAPVTPRTLLGDLAAHRDLALRAVTYAVRDVKPSHLKLVVVLEAADSSTSLAAASVAIFDAKGALFTEYDADAREVATRPIVTASTVPFGEYRVRVAARDSAGRLGAVDDELVAGFTGAGPWQLSDFMVGTMTAGTFTPHLEFQDEKTITAYLELYGTVTPESRPVIAAEIATAADGAAIVTATASIQETKDRDRWIVTAPLPIATLDAGRYIIRLVVRHAGTTVASPAREIRVGQRRHD